MLVAVSRFRVSREEADAIADRFRARSRLVDAHPGFLGLEVMKSNGTSPEFLLVTRWATKEALRDYLRSADFRKVHAQGEEQDAEMTVYEVVAT